MSQDRLEVKLNYRQDIFNTQKSSKNTGIELRQKHRKTSAMLQRHQYINTLKTSENPIPALQNPSLLVELSRLEAFLSKSEPEFSYLIQMGNIKFIIDSLSNSAESSEFFLIVTNLCVFTSGPAFCNEYLQEFKIQQILLSKLDLVRESSDLAAVVNLISNSICNFSAFFEFLRCEGFLKLQKSCVSLGFSEEIATSLKFLCINLSFYSHELGLFDGKLLVNWIEQVLKFEKKSDLILDTIEIIASNTAEFKLTSNIVEHLIKRLSTQNRKKIVKILKIIGNISINKLHFYTEQEFVRIFQRACEVFEVRKVKSVVFWLLRSFMQNLEVAKYLLNSENYEILSEGLADPEPKIRKNALKFFKDLFSTAYYTSGEFTLIITFLEKLKQGLQHSESPESIFNCLKVFKKILNDGKCSKSIMTSIDYSGILETIDNYFDHPNNSIGSLVFEIYTDLSLN